MTPMTAFLRRRNPAIRVLLPENEPDRTRFAREFGERLGSGMVTVFFGGSGEAQQFSRLGFANRHQAALAA